MKAKKLCSFVDGRKMLFSILSIPDTHNSEFQNVVDVQTCGGSVSRDEQFQIVSECGKKTE